MGRPRSCECGTCKKCLNRLAQAKWWASLTPEQRAAKIAARDPAIAKRNDEKRNKTERRRSWWTADIRRRRALEPEKYRARTAVANALRDGKLQRQPCEVCRAPRSEAHHDDYDKPLAVRWLCNPHHKQAHG